VGGARNFRSARVSGRHPATLSRAPHQHAREVLHPIEELLGDPEFSSSLAAGLDADPAPLASVLGAALAAVFGPSAMAVIHYGSQAHRSDARSDSAYDFFVIVDNYRDAYQSLTSSVRTALRASTAVSLAHVLPPNVHAITAPPDTEHRSKCAVLSLRELSLAARMKTADHFTQGRLFQNVQLLWARDGKSREAVRSALVEIRARTFQWGRCFLPESFDVETYCRTLLETCFSAEVRPEGDDRVGQLLDAQRDTLVPVYGVLLERLSRKRILVRTDNVYRQAAPPTPVEVRRMRRYFFRSKARATVRWAKHVALYDDWLEYIVQKISRRTGIAVELTERERRWPFIFLWPKALLFLRTRPQRRRINR
jgi:hypothetical protein